MIDIDRDWTLLATGDVKLVTGTTALAQRLGNRLNTNQGQWAFNLRHGVPWLASILGESGDSAAVRELITKQIMQDTEVAAIGQFSATFNNTTRRFTYTIQVRATDGTTVATTTAV